VIFDIIRNMKIIKFILWVAMLAILIWVIKGFIYHCYSWPLPDGSGEVGHVCKWGLGNFGDSSM